MKIHNVLSVKIVSFSLNFILGIIKKCYLGGNTTKQKQNSTDI